MCAADSRAAARVIHSTAMPSTSKPSKFFRLALVIFALLLSLAHAPARLDAQERDEDEREDRAEFFDRAEDEEDLNRELWEYVKGTPYASALAYVAQAQARAARVAEAA